MEADAVRFCQRRFVKRAQGKAQPHYHTGVHRKGGKFSWAIGVVVVMAEVTPHGAKSMLQTT